MLKKLFFLDIILAILVIILIGTINPDLILITAYLLITPYLYLTKRKNHILFFGLSSLFAFVWIIIAHNQYGYNYEYLKIFNVPALPFYAWSIGLFFVYLIYAHLKNKVKNKFVFHLLLYSFIFWLLLLSAETLAYHVLMVRNETTGLFPGLPICDCIHTPRWMQAVYLLMGPVYFSVGYLLTKKNNLYFFK